MLCQNRVWALAIIWRRARRQLAGKLPVVSGRDLNNRVGAFPRVALGTSWSEWIMSYLTIWENDGKRIFPVSAQAVLGRDLECSIRLDDLRSSRKHLEIFKRDGQYYLRDLGSTNGTFVGGKRLSEPLALEDGMEITVGSTLMRFTHVAPSGETIASVSRAPVSAVAPKPHPEPPPASEAREAVRKPERNVQLPSGTLVVPLDRFADDERSRKDENGAKRRESATVMRLGGRLQSLYQLLRESASCTCEEELLRNALRILGEVFPGAKLNVLFEKRLSSVVRRRRRTAAGLEANAKDNEILELASWRDPEIRHERRTSRLFSGLLAESRAALLLYSREHGVALLSRDVLQDGRVRNRGRAHSSPPADSAQANEHAGNSDVKKGSESEESELKKDGKMPVALLVAPLLNGREMLGWLTAERRVEDEKTSSAGGSLRRTTRFRRAAFGEEDLEFLAAAAYPLAALWAALQRQERQGEENTRLRAAVAAGSNLIGASSVMSAVKEAVKKIASADSPVLILGESGTGKEVVARMIHDASHRKSSPFLAINCGALPENLVESELFGHVRGAFTGAAGERLGCFEAASGGTLLLDEIGELPVHIQTRLLRVLESGEYARVGESRLRKAECRVLAATNRDLAADVKEGRFRRDLYYRLHVMELRLPSLREHLDDLPDICKHLLHNFGSFHLTAEALAVLAAYAWPGNVRELRNVLERMTVLARPSGNVVGFVTLTAADVPLDVRTAAEKNYHQRRTSTEAAAVPAAETSRPLWKDAFVVSAETVRSMDDLQADYARWVLGLVGGNKSRAAEILGVQRSTLYAWTDWREEKRAEKAPPTPEQNAAECIRES
jgi:transcriptional regulator with GAF, ATPase, and Fis domain